MGLAVEDDTNQDSSSPAMTRIQALPWEPIFYGLIFVLAAGMRLWDLGSGAYHHDEGLHAYYSWQLFDGRGYEHNPLLHGPFLFHLTAGSLFLFGDNLVAPRIFPALFGSALVLMPLLLRGYIGRWGAIATATMLTFSPSILYFSRYIRNDIFSIVFDLALVIVVWRYIATQKPRYLYLAAVVLALTFSTKETSFITLAIVGSFLFVWWARSWLPLLWSRVKGSKIRRLRVRLDLKRASPQAALFILMATLTLPLFSAGFGWLVDLLPLDYTLVNPQSGASKGVVGAPVGGTGAYAAAGIIAGVLFIVGGLIGLVWRRWVWLVAFGVFYGIFFLLHTTVFTNMLGFGSGVWASLGYWIGQQSVERANQPWYYYFIGLPLYETLPFFFGIAAIVLFSIWRGRWFLGWTLIVAVIAIASAMLIGLLTDASKALYVPLAMGLLFFSYMGLARGNKFDWFLVHMALFSMFFYVVAGEKMPWLLTHLTLPFILLAGRFIGHLVTSISWQQVFRNGEVLVLVAIPLLLLAVRAMVLADDFDQTRAGVWTLVGATGFLAVTLGLCAVAWFKVGAIKFAQLAAVAVVAILFLVTVRTAGQASYVNRDDPKELMVYAGASDDVSRLIARIERSAEESGKGLELPILVDNGFSWPGYWYFRNYNRVLYKNMDNHEGTVDTDVAILSSSNGSKIKKSADRFDEGMVYQVRIWFPRSAYYRYKPETFFDDFLSASSWSQMLDYYINRTLSTNPDHDDLSVY
ncbi:TIGR03663 family protein, partial [Dehalococcoidia bacterium]|nr:TIGR03663 family protein [Dehalococcoidia bacterium]